MFCKLEANAMFYVQFLACMVGFVLVGLTKILKNGINMLIYRDFVWKKRFSVLICFFVDIFKDKGVKMVQKCSEKRQRGFIQLVIETFKRSKVEIVCNIFSSKFTLFAPSPKVSSWWGWWLTCWLLTSPNSGHGEVDIWHADCWPQ